MRARPPNLQPKPPHAAPGAFEIPAELLTYPIPPQIVVGLAQESFNRLVVETVCPYPLFALAKVVI